jgi:hypothetical protein
MLTLLRCIAVASFASLALPAWGQATSPSTGTPSPSTHNPTGAVGTSKPGESGAPGGKSGPTAGSPSTGTTSPSTHNPTGAVGTSRPSDSGAPGSK